MKKNLLIIIGLILLLAACGDKATNKNTDGNAEEQPNETTFVEEEQNEESEESEEDGTLTEMEKIFKDEELGSTVELISEIEINDTIDLSPIELTIKDVKIIKMYDMKEDLLMHISQFTNKEELNYIQIRYEVKNTEDNNVRVDSPIEAVVLNTGEQIDVFGNDFVTGSNFHQIVHGKAKNKSSVNIIIEDSDPEEIKEMKLITGIIQTEYAETLVEEQSATYELK